MSTTADKLDEVMEAVKQLSDKPIMTQRDLTRDLTKDLTAKFEERFSRLEEDVGAAQEDATERAIRRAKRDRPIDFRQKGHEDQFVFNADIEDRLESAAKKMKRLAPATEKETKVLQEAYEELREGMTGLAERQKHIRIADQSKASWRAVAAYKKLGIGDNEEDNKRIKQASKEAEEEVAQERKTELLERQSRGKTPQLPSAPAYPMFYGQQLLGPPLPPPPPGPMFQPGPPRQLPFGNRGAVL